MIKKFLPVAFLFCTTVSHANMGYVSPFILLYNTNSWTEAQTFASSTTFSSSTVNIGGVRYFFQSTIPASGDLILHRIGGSSFTYWGGDGGAGGGGGGDNLGSGVATQSVNAGNFSIYNASGVIVGSFTWSDRNAGVSISSMNADGSYYFLLFSTGSPNLPSFSVSPSSAYFSMPIIASSATLYNFRNAGTINTGDNPVDWTKLKGVPAGFSDGVDDTGGGGGGGGDNMGSGVATMTINANSFTIENSSGVHITSSAVGSLIIGTQTAPTAFFSIVSTPGTTTDQIVVSTGTRTLFLLGTRNLLIGTTSSTFLGRIGAGSGNATNPGIYFLENTGSGFEYASSGNIIYFVTNGTRRFFTDNAGIQSTGYLSSTLSGLESSPNLRIVQNAKIYGLYTPGSGDNADSLNFVSKSLHAGTIDNSGKWGIGTGSGGVVGQLHVSSRNAPVSAILLTVSTGAANAVDSSNTPFAVGTTSSNLNVDLFASSVSVKPGKNLTIGGRPIFTSTQNVSGQCDGMAVIYDTGTIVANTSLTISASQWGGTTICGAKAGEIEQVNAASNTVRIKSLSGLPSSFTIYNADVTNTQGYWVEFWIK